MKIGQGRVRVQGEGVRVRTDSRASERAGSKDRERIGGREAGR